MLSIFPPDKTIFTSRRDWLLFLPLASIIIFLFTLFFQHPRDLASPLANAQVLSAQVSTTTPAVLAAYPQEFNTLTGEPLEADARPIIVRNYLSQLTSPLVSYADEIVTAGDIYGVDPYLIVAIAQKESSLGKYVPENCYNAWGWGITKAGTRCFSSWADGIDSFTREFSKSYIGRGLSTPSQIMTRYNSTSPNGEWARDVAEFLEKIQG